MSAKLLKSNIANGKNSKEDTTPITRNGLKKALSHGVLENKDRSKSSQ